MLRLSKLADYATVVMVYLCKHRDDFLTAKHIASETHLTVPTVSKLLKLLTAAGLLASHRGSKGGYAFARAPESISVEDIIAAVEGRPALTECSQLENHCVLQTTCPVRANWQLINMAISKALAEVSLAALASPHAENLKLNWGNPVKHDNAPIKKEEMI